jgi:hypothetical protein
MRLLYEVFMTSALVIVALVGVATWGLLAISRLVGVSRGIATQSEEGRGGRFLVRLPRDVAPPVGAASAWGER